MTLEQSRTFVAIAEREHMTHAVADLTQSATAPCCDFDSAAGQQ